MGSQTSFKWSSIQASHMDRQPKRASQKIKPRKVQENVLPVTQCIRKGETKNHQEK